MSGAGAPCHIEPNTVDVDISRLIYLPEQDPSGFIIPLIDGSQVRRGEGIARNIAGWIPIRKNNPAQTASGGNRHAADPVPNGRWDIAPQRDADQ